MCQLTAGRLAVLLAISLLGVGAAAKQCRKLDATLSKLCGYEYTADFLLESHFNSSRRAVYHIASVLSNCSEYSSLIACALYLPRCEEHIPGPYLPCKRVCNEYMKSCGDTIIANGLEWSAGMCQLLPDSDDPNTDKGYLGRCFEPPNFKVTPGKVEFKCQKLVVPLCQGLGYNGTVISEANQWKYYGSLGHFIGNHTADGECGRDRRQIVCAEFFPSCVDNKIQYLCRDKCNEFFHACKSPFFYGKDICMEFPEGNSSNNLCHQQHWPRYKNWPTPPTATTMTTAATTTGVLMANNSMENTRAPTRKPESDQTGHPSVLAARSKHSNSIPVSSIVVPLAVVLTVALAILAFLMYRKKRKDSGQFRYKKHIIYAASQSEEI